jgi:hypothetical protein
MPSLTSRIPIWIPCSIHYRESVALAVDIEVFAQLLPGQPRRRTLEIQGPATARDLARAIGLKLSDIGLISINGVQSELDDPVQPDSRICFFPYLAGG